MTTAVILSNEEDIFLIELALRDALSKYQALDKSKGEIPYSVIDAQRCNGLLRNLSNNDIAKRYWELFSRFKNVAFDNTGLSDIGPGEV